MTKIAHPTIDNFKELLLVLDKQGVTKAAVAAHTSQPTMTRRLKVFQQEEGGVDVLQKRGKSLVPTALGLRAMPAINDLVRKYDHLIDFFQGEANSPQVVRVGTGSFAAEHYLPRALAELSRTPVDWELKTSVCRGRQRILRTAKGRYDLSVVSHDPLQIETLVATQLGTGNRLEVEPLARQPFCLIAQRDSTEGEELAKFPVEGLVPAIDLTRWRLVGLDPESGIRRKIQRHLVGLKRPDLHFFSQSGHGGWPIAREYARQGLGVAILPLACLTAADAEDLTIRRLSEELVMEDYLIHRSDPLNAAQLAVKESLLRAAARHEQNVARLWKQLA